MKRTILILLLVSFISVCLFSGISYAVSPETQAEIIANENLKERLEGIEFCYEDFHFNSLEDVQNAYLGRPLKTYSINNNNLSNDEQISKQLIQNTFYVFPILVDGEAITDLTVSLKSKQWKVIDLGGHLSTAVYDKAKQIGNDPTDYSIVRYAGQTYVVTDVKGKEMGYAPYLGDDSLDLSMNKLVDSEKLREAMKHQYDETSKQNSNNSDEDGMGGYPRGSFYNTDFSQENIFKRINNYLNYVIGNY